MAVPVAFASGAEAATKRRPPFSEQKFLRLFDGLPGRLGLRVHAPAANGDSGLDVARRAGEQLFIGSAFKAFVLAETLRRADSPDVVQTLTARQLDLNASVWTSDSATFNPPNLIGQVSQRSALEAMINHSDNTATDMSIKAVGIGNVRAFLKSAGLRNSLVPESTRAFIGYLLGVKDYKKFTWADLQAAGDDPFVKPALNQTQSMASTANDLISFYSRSLRGAFFTHPQTLTEYRRILTFGDAIASLPVPLGVSAYAKGGTIVANDFRALSIPGAMYFDDRWVFFAATLNWTTQSASDDTLPRFVAALRDGLAMVKDSLERR